jgi:hypothetical protein
MENNEEEEDDNNYSEFPKILQWGKMKNRHQISPLVILVRPLLIHRETVKLKRRG